MAASAAGGAGGEPGGRGASAAGGAGTTRYCHWAIRACSGHTYPFIRTDRLCAPILNEQLHLLSTLVHVTQWENIHGILREGLIPGGGADGGRPHIYFAPFLPDDPRFMTGKRGSPFHEIAIVYDPHTVAQEVQLVLTANGCVLSEQPVSSQNIFCVYLFHPQS